jgi:hypothetical protein
MINEKVTNESDENFERYTGITKALYWEMVCLLIKAKLEKAKRGGRKSKVVCADMVFMAIEYWREYRTFFHIGVNYGVSESNCRKIIIWVENVLIRSGEFSLPGKKALLKDDAEMIPLTDVSEIPIERPKKNSGDSTQARKRDTH